jgi:hypothetical protein
MEQQLRKNLKRPTLYLKSKLAAATMPAKIATVVRAIGEMPAKFAYPYKGLIAPICGAFLSGVAVNFDIGTI